MLTNHAVDGIDGSPTIMMHNSLGCALRMWDPQVEPLIAEGARVIRYDYRGHGLSPQVPGPYTLQDLGGDALDLMESVHADHAIHVGLSLGGMVAMWLAERAPSRVSGLVLCATSAELTPSSAWRERATDVRRAGNTHAIADAFLPRWLSPDFSITHPDIVEWVRAQLVETSAEGFAGGCEAVASMDLISGLAEVRVPVSVLVGHGDAGTPPEHAERIASTIPNASLEVVEPGAHLLNVERPEVVTNAVINLLHRVSG